MSTSPTTPAFADPLRDADHLTPATAVQVAEALGRAWVLAFGHVPERRNLLLPLCQWALETGWSRSMHNYNFGNVKSRPGDGRRFVMFECGENLNAAQVKQALAQAKPRTDGKPGLDAVVVRWDPDGKGGAEMMFYPDHPQTRFRSFATLDEGALDYLQLLHKRFTKAWPYLLAGDPGTFVDMLKAEGYFTAAVGPYKKTITQLFAQFSKLAFTLPSHDLDADDQTQPQPSSQKPDAAPTEPDIDRGALELLMQQTLTQSIHRAYRNDSRRRDAEQAGEPYEPDDDTEEV